MGTDSIDRQEILVFLNSCVDEWSDVQVRVVETTDQDLGPIVEHAFVPRNPMAAPLEVVVLCDGSTAVFIDSYDGLARRLGLKNSAPPDLVALHDGPRAIETSILKDLIHAVSTANVNILVGVVGSKIVWTSGFVNIGRVEYAMNGSVGGGVVRYIASTLGFSRQVKVRYEPWTVRRGHR